MRILVTGINGQVGHELSLLAKGCKNDWIFLDRIGLDVTQHIDVKRVIDEFSPDFVINATAYTAVDKAETEKELALAVNKDAARYLAQACEQNNAVLLHISTDYVFAGDGVNAYNETDTVAPSSHYGVSKLAGEYEVIQYCTKHIILRTSWVFGQHGSNFVKTMIRIAQGRNTLNVVDDQFGAPTSANGIANALLSIVNQVTLGKDCWGIYHYSGSPYVSWYDFADVIFNEAERLKILPHSVTINAISSNEYTTIAKRPANSRLDCTKIKSVFGIVSDDWHLQLIKILENINQK